MRNKWWARLLRIVGIVFMSLTALFTLMGGAGTTCVALNPTGYDGKFAGIAPFQWLWILFVLAGVAAGVMGVRAVVLLIKGTKSAYRAALFALVLGTVVNAVHLIASRILRGGSMPVDAVLYTNVLTLVIFLLFRIPGIWQGVNYEKPAGEKSVGRDAMAAALSVCGLLALTIQYWMAPTHTIGGINYSDAWHTALTLIGWGLIAASAAIVLYPSSAPARREILVGTVE
jgi:hypothetical protein